MSNKIFYWAIYSIHQCSALLKNHGWLLPSGYYYMLWLQALFGHEGAQIWLFQKFPLQINLVLNDDHCKKISWELPCNCYLFCFWGLESQTSYKFLVMAETGAGYHVRSLNPPWIIAATETEMVEPRGKQCVRYISSYNLFQCWDLLYLY